MKRSKGFSLVEIMVVISIIVILVALFAGRNMTRAKARAQFTACCQNVKGIATALHAYSVENGGRYPNDLDTLKPKFLPKLPSCPAAGFATYNSSGNYITSTIPDAFTVRCGPATGNGYHRTLGKSNYCPQYTLEKGLVSEE